MDVRVSCCVLCLAFCVIANFVIHKGSQKEPDRPKLEQKGKQSEKHGSVDQRAGEKTHVMGYKSVRIKSLPSPVALGKTISLQLRLSK